MNGRLGLAVIVALVALLLVSPGVSHAQLVLYDDFTASKINPAKWFGFEVQLGSPAPNTEAIRKVASGQLNLLLTSFGSTSSDVGTAGAAFNGMVAPFPDAITTIQAAVTVKSPVAQRCPANTTSTRSLAQIFGIFFNDGTSPAPGDRTGDIFAGIQKVKDSSVGSQIQAFYGRCTNAACSTFTTLASHTFTATWLVGVADTLRMQWDATGNQFLFALNPGTAGAEAAALAYTVSDTAAANGPVRELRIRNSVASCTAGQKKASMLALFDNVMVNP